MEIARDFGEKEKETQKSRQQKRGNKIKNPKIDLHTSRK